MKKLDIARGSGIGLSAGCYGVSFFQIDTLPEKRMSSVYSEYSEKCQFPTGCLCLIY